MSRDGAGNYVLPSGNPVTTNTPISSTVQNNTMNDVAAALTSSLAKDGQTVPTNNLPMGGFKHSNVANGVAATDYAALGQVQSGSALVAVAAGTADALTGAFTPAITALTAGLTLIVRAASANATATPTFKADGTAAKTIVKGNNLPLVTADIAGAGHWLMLTYDVTLAVFVLDNPANQVSTALQATSINGGPLAGLRNRIINGDMRVDQRNNGAAVAIPLNNNAFSVDRWFVGSNGGTATAQRISGASAGLLNALQVNGSIGHTSGYIAQRIESSNVADLVNKTVTLSFKALITNGGQITANVASANAVDNFSATTSIATLNTTTASSSYQTFTLAFNAGANAANGLVITFTIGAMTSSQAIALTGVQLEASGVATPLEQIPIGLELSLCQRYYQLVGNGMAGVLEGTTLAWIGCALPIPMRATPSLAQLVTNPTIRANGTNVSASGSTVIGSSLSANGVGVIINGFTGLTNGQGTAMETGNVFGLSAEL